MAMKDVLNLFVAGANGRMGKHIIQLILGDPDLQLAGAVEHPDCPVLGADAGLNAGAKQSSVSITSDLKRFLEKCPGGVIVDFSSVENTLENIKRAVQYTTPIVVGTTGFTADEIQMIKDSSKKVPLLLAPNMSIGMNVMFKLINDAAKVLRDDYDIEILEAHHKDKIDAPSGSALKIAEILCHATERSFPENLRHERRGKEGPRKKKEIGMQVLRGGDTVGEHTVYYYGSGERLEIKHTATSRLTFAAGSLRAAKWIKNKPPGLYDMADVLSMG